MKRAVIVIRDGPDDEIEIEVEFHPPVESGDPQSPAQQLAIDCVEYIKARAELSDDAVVIEEKKSGRAH